MESRTPRREIFPENYRFLQEHVRAQVGIVLEDNKHYLFESRLAPLSSSTALAPSTTCARYCVVSVMLSSLIKWSRP